MAAPNLLALILLAGVLVKEKVKYMKEQREEAAGKDADEKGPSDGQ